jgi:AAA family ATPase
VPKKKYLQHISHHSAAEEKEIEKSEKSKTIEYTQVIESTDQGNSEKWDHEDEKFIRHLYLSPAGYPIKPFDQPDNLRVVVNDPKLFQAYAGEQWIGLAVNVDDYIFDQLIIPDFAFKITRIVPKDAHRISVETKFHLNQTEIPKPKFQPVAFNDIVGNQQAIDKAKIISEFLKKPQSFGKWAPKNILFYGPPGTGKTLTAKAIASGAKCTFFARKGTTLIGLHVGDGASKIHQLFAEAKENAPAIIFIDEIDAIGLNRSYQSVRGDVVEVATALLSELDGLEENERVITIAATNSIDLIDPGLRSRFEEEIDFPLPNEAERVQLLQLFAKDLPVKISADFGMIAKRIDKWSGRDIHEKLMKVAVHKVIENNLAEITTDLFNKIIDQILKQQRIFQPPSNFFL